jgi:hypothetical protein
VIKISQNIELSDFTLNPYIKYFKENLKTIDIKLADINFHLFIDQNLDDIETRIIGDKDKNIFRKFEKYLKQKMKKENIAFLRKSLNDSVLLSFLKDYEKDWKQLLSLGSIKNQVIAFPKNRDYFFQLKKNADRLVKKTIELINKKEVEFNPIVSRFFKFLVLEVRDLYFSSLYKKQNQLIESIISKEIDISDGEKQKVLSNIYESRLGKRIDDTKWINYGEDQLTTLVNAAAKNHE